MEFENNQSIYLQIADSISEKIVNGRYKPDEKIPSVREMASQMGVNPNTIMRTFSELQAKGIIENKRGIGYFVSEEAPAKIKEEKKEVFFKKILPEFIRQASLLGVTSEELKSHLDI
ncbi:MAG: GntR family transcriptional regulator [Cyclobacteriaceae bacterium]